MTKPLTRRALPLFGLALTSCASDPYPLDRYEEVQSKTVVEAPAPDPVAIRNLDPGQVARGKYLIEIIGCGACHTDGAIIGEPNAARLLAGSGTGIAYTSPLKDKYPGVVYPPNLTPDDKTGLGNWSDAQIAAAIRSGTRRPGFGHRLIVMSWPLYQHLSDEDVQAIVTYLRSIPAVEHQVPPNVPPGTKAAAPYVHFGVYRSRG